MIKIRHSKTPYIETELEASKNEFVELRNRILNMTENKIIIPSDTKFDPQPYNVCLEGIVIQITEWPLIISVEGNNLLIRGKKEYIDLFAENFPYDVEMDEKTTIPYHMHFDSIGREDMVKKESIELILTLKG